MQLVCAAPLLWAQWLVVQIPAGPRIFSVDLFLSLGITISQIDYLMTVQHQIVHQELTIWTLHQVFHQIFIANKPVK